MANFGQFLAKMAKTVKIIKKALGKFFSHLQALTKCKVAEKGNEWILRKASRKNGRTNGHTGRRDSPLVERSKTMFPPKKLFI